MLGRIRKMGAIALYVVIALSAGQHRVAAQELTSDFINIPYYFQHREDPNFIVDLRKAFRDCLADEWCGTVVAALDLAAGVAPGTTAAVVEIADVLGLGPDTTQNGDERYTWIRAPQGYAVCKVAVSATSKGRTHPGQIWVAAKKDRVRITTKVQDPNFAQNGRSVDAYLVVMLVKDSLYPHHRTTTGECNTDPCWNVGMYCGGAVGCGYYPKVGVFQGLTINYGHLPFCPGDHL